MEFIDLKTQYRNLKDSIHARMNRVLEHGQYILGPEVAELEQKLASYTGARHCITVASGTEALLISLMALGVKPGDEVITSPFTFVATAEVIALCGATPVFVDIQPDTYNMDPALLEAAITSRTRAIMPVSLYGQPADMDEINSIAKLHHLPVIEDACQSFGAEYKGKKSCNLSSIGCTSFFPSKPLGCYGDGGAIFTSDDSMAQACREIRVHGQEKRYYHTRIGVGGRMDTLQCAVVLAKLERFEEEVKARQQIGAYYHKQLAGITGIGLTSLRPDRTSVHAQYTIAVDHRDKFLASLKEVGIPTTVHYPVPLHRQPAYANICRSGDLSHSERAAQWVVSLPMSADLAHEDQETIVNAVVRVLGY